MVLIIAIGGSGKSVQARSKGGGKRPLDRVGKTRQVVTNRIAECLEKKIYLIAVAHRARREVSCCDDLLRSWVPVLHCPRTVALGYAQCHPTLSVLGHPPSTAITGTRLYAGCPGM